MNKVKLTSRINEVLEEVFLDPMFLEIIKNKNLDFIENQENGKKMFGEMDSLSEEEETNRLILINHILNNKDYKYQLSKKISMSGGNPQSIKEILKEAIRGNDNFKNFSEDDLNIWKDQRTEEGFIYKYNEGNFEVLNIRNTLIPMGTEICRYNNPDIHVLNHVVNILKEIEENPEKEIPLIVTIVGLAGHGKDYQLELLKNEEVKTMGDVRFENEIKFAYIVNKYKEDKPKLKKHLEEMVKGFNYNPKKLQYDTYQNLLGYQPEEMKVYEEIRDTQEDKIVVIKKQIDNKQFKSIEHLSDLLFTLEQEKILTKEGVKEIIEEIKERQNKQRKKITQEIINEIKTNSDQIENIGPDFENLLKELDPKSIVDKSELINQIRKEGLLTKTKINKLITQEYMRPYKPKNLEIIRNFRNENPKNEKYVNSILNQTKENFEEKRELSSKLVGKETEYGNSNIRLTPEEKLDLTNNFIYVIHKVFELPKYEIKENSTYEEYKTYLINYHLENIWKPNFGNSKDKYKNEIEVSFKNHEKSNKSLKIKDLSEKEKIELLQKLLNTHGLARSNYNHESEKLPEELGIMKEIIIPFTKENTLIDKILNEINRKKDKEKKEIGKTP